MKCNRRNAKVVAWNTELPNAKYKLTWLEYCISICCLCLKFSIRQFWFDWLFHRTIPESKVQVVNMRPTWVLSAPGGPRVGPINLAIRGYYILFGQGRIDTLRYYALYNPRYFKKTEQRVRGICHHVHYEIVLPLHGSRTHHGMSRASTTKS